MIGTWKLQYPDSPCHQYLMTYECRLESTTFKCWLESTTFVELSSYGCRMLAWEHYICRTVELWLSNAIDFLGVDGLIWCADVCGHLPSKNARNILWDVHKHLRPRQLAYNSHRIFLLAALFCNDIITVNLLGEIKIKLGWLRREMISDLQTIENCSYILNQSQLQITKVQFQNVQPVLTLELKPVYLKYLKTRFSTVFRQSLDSPTPNSLTNCGFSLAHSRKFAQNSSSKHFVAKARRIT